MSFNASPGEELPVGVNRASQLNVVLVKCSHERIIAAEHVAVAYFNCRSRVNGTYEVPYHGGLEGDLEAHRCEGSVGKEKPGEKVGCFSHSW
jgi:hypothetical protein